MEISVSSNVVTVVGNIKSVSDYQEIKAVLDAMVGTHKAIVIIIKDSLSITSSVIGYLNKLVLKDGIDLSMNIGNEQLMELLVDLNLDTLFKARKV